MMRLRAKFLAVLVAAMLMCCSMAVVAATPGIFDLLMPGQTATREINLPDPPEYIKTQLANFLSVQNMELRTYAIKAGVTDAELLKSLKNTLRQQGWDDQIAKNLGKNYDAVFNHTGKDDFIEYMMIEIVGARRTVDFTRISGTKSGANPAGDTGVNRTVFQKQVPSSVNTLRITASGPVFTYDAWSRDLVQIERTRAGGQFTMPDIVPDGPGLRIDLPATTRPDFDSTPGGQDYALHGPQRLAVIMNSTGSDVIVTLTSIKGLSLKAANARVTVTGALISGDHNIEVVNQRAVLRLDDVTGGTLKVTATNAEIAMTLPKTASVSVNANAVAGTVAVTSPGQPTSSENPYKQSFGAGAAQVTLESVGGKITLKFK